jgi:hypothetical protein
MTTSVALLAVLGVWVCASADICTQSAGLDVYGAEPVQDPVPSNSSGACCEACWAVPECRGSVFWPDSRSCLLLKSWRNTVKHPTHTLSWKSRGLTHADVYVIMAMTACLVLALYGCCVYCAKLRRPARTSKPDSERDAAVYQQMLDAA